MNDQGVGPYKKRLFREPKDIRKLFLGGRTRHPSGRVGEVDFYSRRGEGCEVQGEGRVTERGIADGE